MPLHAVLDAAAARFPFDGTSLPLLLSSLVADTDTAKEAFCYLAGITSDSCVDSNASTTHRAEPPSFTHRRPLELDILQPVKRFAVELGEAVSFEYHTPIDAQAMSLPAPAVVHHRDSKHHHKSVDFVQTPRSERIRAQAASEQDPVGTRYRLRTAYTYTRENVRLPEDTVGTLVRPGIIKWSFSYSTWVVLLSRYSLWLFIFPKHFFHFHGRLSERLSGPSTESIATRSKSSAQRLGDVGATLRLLSVFLRYSSQSIESETPLSLLFRHLREQALVDWAVTEGFEHVFPKLRPRVSCNSCQGRGSLSGCCSKCGGITTLSALANVTHQVLKQMGAFTVLFFLNYRFRVQKSVS
jgi:hypothetical protein